MENNILNKAKRMINYIKSLHKVANFSDGLAFDEADRLFRAGVNITAESPEQIWGKEVFVCEVCDPYTKHSEINIQNHIQSQEHKERCGELIVIPERAGLESVFAEYGCTKICEAIQKAKNYTVYVSKCEKKIRGIIS